MKLWRSVKNHLVPWRGNTHRPHILRRGWLMAFLALALISEGAIMSHTLVPREGPNVFLAAVLRSDLISYTGKARADEGGRVLIENEALDAAAQAKAEDMAARSYFSHVGPDGEEPWVWIERAGYDYVYAGENLAVRFEDSKDVVDAWMASPTHRANIVKPQYQEVGVGVADGTYKGGPATFVVQYFGSPAAPAVSAAPEEPATLAYSGAAETADAAGAADAAGVAKAPAASATHDELTAVAGAETHAQAEAAPAPQQPQGQKQSLVRTIGEALGETGSGAQWILGGIAALLIVVLALTFFIRIQVQPTDLLLPGLAVALVAITFMAANAKLLPAATQGASVAGSLPGDIGGGIAVERVSAFPEAPAAQPAI